MKWIWAATLAVIMLPVAPRSAGARPLLYDPVALNIGVNCQWQSRCISQQHGAMRQALNYVAKQRPPQSRVHLCNRNARRTGNRVDWIGFNHCIRNVALTPVNRARR